MHTDPGWPRGPRMSHSAMTNQASVEDRATPMPIDPSTVMFDASLVSCIFMFSHLCLILVSLQRSACCGLRVASLVDQPWSIKYDDDVAPKQL
jgi:hypothetical protein